MTLPPLRLVAAVLVLTMLVPGAIRADTTVGTAKRVVNDVTTQSFGQPVETGDGLVANETVVTRDKSAIDIRLTDQSTVVIGENSELVLDELVYARDKNKVSGAFRMVSGAIRFASAGAAMEFFIKTPTATIGIRGTRFDVLVDDQGTEVAVIEGIVFVTSRFGRVDVGAGQAYRVTDRQATFLNQRSAEFERAVQFMLAMIGGSAPAGGAGGFATAGAQAGGQGQVASLPPVLAGKDTENLLRMDLPQGRVYIELLPHLAPAHVRRIKQLVRQEFYDGLAFHYVRQDYVAETGDPSYGRGQSSGGGTGTSIPGEFSPTPFTEGTVGMSRLQDDPDSADSRFFIALGPTARSLDGKYTVWGRVVSGLQYLKALKKANKPGNPERIQRMRVVADLYN